MRKHQRNKREKKKKAKKKGKKEKKPQNTRTKTYASLHQAHCSPLASEPLSEVSNVTFICYCIFLHKTSFSPHL